MDTEALKTFLSIAQTRSFSVAAGELHRTQPAISRRIALLEQELNTTLFERVSGGVVLSEAGRVLLPLAERALVAIKEAAEAVRSLNASNIGPVSIAIVGTLASTELTAVLRRFARQYPGVTLKLSTATSGEVSERVRRGDATIGIRYFNDPAPDLLSEMLTRERLVVISGRRHRLAGKRISSVSALQTENWFAFPTLAGTRELSLSHIHALFETRGLRPLAWTTVDSLTAQKRLVEAGFGLALVPLSAITEELARKSLATISIGDLDASNLVSIVVRRGGYLSMAANSLLASLKEEYTLAERNRAAKRRHR